MNAKQLKLLALSLAFPTLALSSNAFAECSEMGNAQWNELSRQMSDAYQNGNYEEAVNYGKKLTLICDRSPIINFLLSNSYDKLGMQDESYSYIRKASDYIQEFQVPQPMVEKIWLRRAEFELPYKKQVAELEGKLAAKDQDIAAQQLAFEEKLAVGSNEQLATLSASWDYYEKSMKQIMWVGTGVAIGGAVIAAVGGGLGGFYTGEANDYLNKLVKYSTDTAKRKKYKNLYADNNDYKVAAFSVMGIGLGLGIGGAITAIVSYVKANEMKEMKDEQASEMDAVTDDTSVSFTISPNSVGVGITF